MATVLNSIVAGEQKAMSLAENLDGSLESGYIPLTVLRHGDPLSISDALLGTNNATEKYFTGGQGGIIESLATNESAASTSRWDFFYPGAGVAYKGYTDATRGKVLYNDYASASIDAVIGYITEAPIAQNTDVFWCYHTRASTKGSDGLEIPSGTARQWKVSRGIQTQKTISDSANVNVEQFTAIQYAGSGLQTRIENDAGVYNGTITSATTTVLNQTGGTMVPNVWVGFLVTITKTSDNSKQYAKVLSNTATQIVLQTSITAPIAGDTFAVGGSDAAQYNFGGSPLPQYADGWIFCEGFVNTGTQGQADGSFKTRMSQSGNTISGGSTGVPIYGSARRAAYVPMLQNYFTAQPLSITAKEAWADDAYIQIGSTKRLYLTNSLTLNDATIKEIQPWSSWSSGNVTISKVNKGGVTTSQTLYLVAVEGDNTILWSAEYYLEVA